MTDILPWAPGAGMQYPAGTGIQPWMPTIANLLTRNPGVNAIQPLQLTPGAALARVPYGTVTDDFFQPVQSAIRGRSVDPGFRLASSGAQRAIDPGFRMLNPGTAGPSLATQAATRGAQAQQNTMGSILARGARSATPGAGTAAARAAATAAGEGAAARGAAGLGTRLLGPGGARGLLSRGNLARGLGWGLASGIGGAAASGIGRGLGASEDTAADLGRVASYGLLGAGIGSMTGPGAVVTAPVGAAIGAGVGALGFIPGIENLPIIGGLWGGKSGPSKDDTVRDIRDRTEMVLQQMGADPAFLSRAYRQFDIAMTVQGAKRKSDGSWDYGDLKADEIEQIGTGILDGMIQQFGMEQQNAAQQQQLTSGPGGFNNALAEIMAVQSWMAPLIQQQTATSQQYADQYAASARAAAGSIDDPALAAAGVALGNSYSADQAASNQLAMQQLMYQPQAWQSALEQQYNEQMLALQQQQFAIQQQQAQMGANPNLAPGLYPVG